MNLFPLLYLLALHMSLVREGVSIHLETCECHEIRELVNSSVQQAVGGLEDSLGIMNTAISNINTNLGTILEKVESLEQQKYHTPAGLIPNNPAATCADILTDNPSAQSGLYWIGTLGDSSTQYCDMTLSCGGVTGGWLRVTELDMTDSSHQCPSGLLERIDSGIRTCGRTTSLSSPGCSSVIFTVPSNYSQVCGKIIGFQVGSPDTFGDTGHGTNPSIDTFYVDGVSLTHGNPRQHIWTFAAGLDEVATRPQYNCPCTHTPTASQATPPPAFNCGE